MTTTDETETDEQKPTPIPTFARVPGKKPKYFVAGDRFYAQTDDGELSVPLRFKTRLVREINKLDDNDELEMLFALLSGIGDSDTADRLDELDIFESAGIANAYFQAWQEKHEAALGEAQRSSRS